MKCKAKGCFSREGRANIWPQEERMEERVSTRMASLAASLVAIWGRGATWTD